MLTRGGILCQLLTMCAGGAGSGWKGMRETIAGRRNERVYGRKISTEETIYIGDCQKSIHGEGI